MPSLSSDKRAIRILKSQSYKQCRVSSDKRAIRILKSQSYNNTELADRRAIRILNAYKS